MRNRKIFQFGLVVLTLVLLGAASTNSARAAVVENNTYPIDGDTIVNPCNSATIVMTGNVHELIAVTINEGGSGHIKWHVNSQGLTGIDSVTGDLYKIVVVGNWGETDFTTLPFVVNIVQNIHIIGIGSAPDFSAQYHGHITVNANGETTTEFFIENETCN